MMKVDESALVCIILLYVPSMIAMTTLVITVMEIDNSSVSSVVLRIRVRVAILVQLDLIEELREL